MFDKPAEAYDRYVGRYSTALARALIGIAGIEHGQSALDVGCGPGALTAQLAALLGSDNVTAVDPSASYCRGRCLRVGARLCQDLGDRRAAARPVPLRDARRARPRDRPDAWGNSTSDRGIFEDRIGRRRLTSCAVLPLTGTTELALTAITLKLTV